MIEKILSEIQKLILQNEEGANACYPSAMARESAYYECKEIVQEVAKDGGWIPYTINGELPNNGQRVWLSFTTPYTSYVKSAWWIYDHFEWGNCKKVKDYPLAWKPYEVPAPYQKGE